MSFLLEALRKSENRKHRGGVPTIHSPTEAAGMTRPRRTSAWVLLLAAPLLLILAWAAWRAWSTAPATVSPEEQTAQSASTRPAPPITDGREMASRPAQPPAGARLPLSGDRTPVERYEAAQLEPAEGRPPEPLDQPAPAPDKESVAQAGVSLESPEPDQQQAPAPAESRPAQPRQQPAPPTSFINYWEVPGSVRDQLTEMRITVMVYAERPEDRFILMNGRRWVEGDEPQPGLRLEEIRREGAVFSFRRYRFLVSN